MKALTSCAMAIAATLATLCPAGAQTTAAPPTEQVVARLAQFTDSLAKLDQFSGVVMLVKDRTPVFQRSYGFADREKKKPNTIDTQFNLGSINKIFTQTAIRQLAAAHKLDLAAPFVRYLPDYPNRQVAGHVTVQQLLDMKAGLGGDIFGVPASGSRKDIRRLADYVPLFANEAPVFEPGTKMQYCNACYVLLGLIIEKASGESYYDYVRSHIYEPATMIHTGHFRSDDLPRNAAIGYTRGGPGTANDGPLIANTDNLPGIGSSAGGGYSTAQDLLQFLAALRAHHIPSGPAVGQVGIAGGAPGMNAVMEGDLGHMYDLVVLANMDPPAAMRVADFVRQLLGAN